MICPFLELENRQSTDASEHIVRASDDAESEDNKNKDDEDDAESESSSLSFDALSSAEPSEASDAPETSLSTWRKQRLKLQAHIEDTVDRLHGLALQMEEAGANHRRRRVELYRQKERPLAAFEGYKALALHKAKLQFVEASASFLERLAESFARRRLRFEYLEEHQKKRAIDTHKPVQLEAPAPRSQSKSEADDKPLDEADDKPLDVTEEKKPSSYLQDQRTVHSGTVETKLDPRPQPKRPEKAESVASVALRNTGFPPPPRCVNSTSFQCPYCRLEFRSQEAEKSRWRYVLPLRHIFLNHANPQIHKAALAQLITSHVKKADTSCKISNHTFAPGRAALRRSMCRTHSKGC